MLDFWRMKTASVYEAKTQLSSLLKRVQRGEHVVIESRGKPVAKIVPIGKTKRTGAGMDEGIVFIADDFDAPLPDEILKGFSG